MEDMIEILFEHVNEKEVLTFEEKIKLLSDLEIDFLSSIARPLIVSPNLYFFDTGTEVVPTELNIDLMNFWDAFKEFYEDDGSFDQYIFVKICKIIMQFNKLFQEASYEESCTNLVDNFFKL